MLMESSSNFGYEQSARGAVSACAIKAQSLAIAVKAMLEDIAVLTTIDPGNL